MAEPGALAPVNGDGDPNVNGKEDTQEASTQNDNNSHISNPSTTNDDPSGDSDQIKSSKRKFDEIENEDFVGFPTSTTNSNKKHLASLIEKLEQELGHTPSKKKSAKSNETSRPSSGMSFRSDSDVTGELDDSPTPHTTRNVNRKASIDLASPLYRVPFEHGWKRELVYRGASSTDQVKRQADIYYYAPNGKKLRSTREVLELIAGTELTGENFTFYKEPLGIEDPDKEIIRGAKIKPSGDSSSPYDKSVDSPGDSKRTPKQKSKPLKVKSVGYRLSMDDDSKKGRKSSISGVKKNIFETNDASLSISVLPSSDITIKTEEEDPEPHETSESSMLSALETLSQSTRLTESQLPSHDNETTFFNSEVSIQKLPSSALLTQTYEQPVEAPKGSLEPCSMRCPLAPGEIPTLQCGLCLCLYHNQCAGVPHSFANQYVCLNCQAATSKQFSGKQQTKMNQANSPQLIQSRPTPPRIPQPGLIPISKLVKGQSRLESGMSKPAGKLPKVNDWQQQQQGKCIDGIISHGPPLPKKVTKKDDKLGKTILGTVAPRLPSSTSIQMISKSSPKQAQPPIDPSLHQPQMIGILNGKQYIVVPKHNTLNVPPTFANSTPKQADNAPKLNELSYAVFNPGNEKLKINLQREGDMTPVDPTSIEAVKEAIHQYNESISEMKTSAPTGEEGKKRGRPSGKNENGTLDQKKAKDDQKDHFTEFYATNQAKGYDSLVQIFQYLKMRELASAARVCRLWRDIASTPALWRSVRMKNSQVNDWGGLAAALRRHGTKHLDLRKMLLPSEVPQTTWDQITEHISTVETLTRIDLCRCSASAVEQICTGLPKLEALTASSVRCQIFNPSPFAGLTELRELRIKGMNGLTLSSDLKCLANLKKLKHLSLTSIKDLDKCGGCSWLSSLTELQWLELGEFTVNGQEAAEAFSHLTNLTRLRLERSPIDDGCPAVLKVISKLPRLTHLELINFDIKVGFEAAIGACKNVKRLLIIPTYVSQSATTNRCVLDGVLRLKPSLIQLVWGITIELMRVTELFIDQCDRNTDGAGAQKKKAKNKTQTGECIPVLKPVPGLLGQDIRATPQHGPPQVEILPIPTLQRLLATQLPDTKLKILRIPYHATWRQLLNDND